MQVFKKIYKYDATYMYTIVIKNIIQLLIAVIC